MQLNLLLLTLLTGLFFLMGIGLVLLVKKRDNLVKFSTGMAFIIMLGMIFLDLIPEIVEMSRSLQKTKVEKLIFLFFFLFLGVIILKLFDKFLPHHHHEHHEKEDLKEHNHHLYHIGFMTTFSLILHNVLEGMSIYIIGLENFDTALFTALAVGCHNIPLGIEIASNMFKTKDSMKLKIVMLVLLVCSSTFGALGLYVFGAQLPNVVLLALICVACGMILYIALFELMGEVFNYRKEKTMYYGIILGIFILGLMTFMG